VTLVNRPFRFFIATWIAALAVLPEVRATPPTELELRAKYQVLSTKFGTSIPDWRPSALAVGSLLLILTEEY
jgi:hypothetical protein